MAQDPESEQEQVDPSHDLDMVPLFTSQTVDAEMEADVIRGILESNGIPSVLQRAAQYPNLGFELRVPRAFAEEAGRLIAEQRAAGPEAAAEAEAAGEEQQ
jgi:hypothetical protein